MEPIPVAPHPFRQTFDSIESAVRYAMSHPLLPAASTDTELLLGSVLADAYWGLNGFVLALSNDHWLRIFVEDAGVRWQLHESPPVLLTEPQFRVGAPSIWLRWQRSDRLHEMDSSALVAKRIGASFLKLLVNHTGVYVYFRDHLVFQFNAAYRTDTGEDLLYVSEDD